MANYQGDDSGRKNKTLVLFIGVFTVLIVLIAMIFFAMRIINENKKRLAAEKAAENKAQQAVAPAQSTSTMLALPTGDDLGTDGSNGASEEGWEAQNVSFGDFYKVEREDLKLALPDYTLPQNVKVDVANYYDFSRKINLDAGLDSLNINGFAVIDNPFPAEADNFYKMYSALNSKQVPVLVTSDFLVYYYQNILKNAFKDIEGTVFYENLWQTNKKLYNIAKERYESSLNKKGLANDLALEGSRRELAFFATTLALLAPTEDQIGIDTSLNKKAGFTPSEASDLSFPLPTYLKQDIEREVALIRKAAEKTKSPVLLYERDYKDFAVPAEYKNNARLNNFYLASRWLNSPFPLLYRTDACPECLLDKDDWRLSMYSAFLIADDLSGSQDIQNRWAKIYKIMSFFQGLRGDLNYLYYRQALDQLFGADKKTEEIFSDAASVDDNFSKLQEHLLALSFSGVEGGLDKTSTTTQKALGMKMLVDSYWPTSYILGELTYPAVGLFRGPKEEAMKLATACNPKKNKEEFYRCLGMAFDVISLVNPLENGLGGAYFSSNINYENYSAQAEKLRQQFANFTPLSWHNSNYWSTLETVRKMMEPPDSERPIFMKNDPWRKKELATAVGSWVNLQLPADTFTTYQKEEGGRLGGDAAGGDSSEYAYVEPNLALVRELKANTEMVLSMLKLLKINERENTVLADLGTMKKNFDNLEAIVRKELNSEELSSDDYKFVGNFVTLFAIKEEGAKVLNIGSPSSKNKIQEKLEGVKIEALVYYKDGKRYFAAGPIFNYWESKK